MYTNTSAGKLKTNAEVLRMAAYLLAVTLVFSVISILCAADAVIVPALSPA